MVCICVVTFGGVGWNGTWFAVGIGWNAHGLRTFFTGYCCRKSCGMWVDCAGFHRVVEGFNEFRRAKNYAQMDTSKISPPRFTLMPDYYDYFSLMRIVPAEKMTADEIRFVEKTSHRFGYVHILSKLAEIYVLNDRLEEAAKIMKTLHRLHPFYYSEYHDYWRTLLKQTFVMKRSS